MDMRCSCWKRLVSFLLMNFHRKKDFRAKTNTLAIWYAPMSRCLRYHVTLCIACSNRQLFYSSIVLVYDFNILYAVLCF